MSCKTCSSELTVKEFFESEGKTIENIECSKQIPTINRALRTMRPFIFALPGFIEYKSLDPSKNAVELDCPMFKPIGFYGKGCTNCGVEMNDACEECCCETYMQFNMILKKNIPSLRSGQYQFNCPGTKLLSYSLPNGTEEAYITYFRYFDKIIDENSKIGLPDYLLPGLQLMLDYLNGTSGTYSQGDGDRYSNDFFNWVQQMYKVFRGEVPKKFTSVLAI